MAQSKFPGFSLGLLHFLEELSKHNNRAWFQKNKQRYEQDVVAPSLAFIEAMAGPLAKISPHFRAIPKKQGGSLLRIYRDTRFGHDKTPYKTNVGIHFRHETAKDVHAPGFYFHIEPEQVFLGAGSWHPAAPTLTKIRNSIAKRPAEWKKARDARAFRRRFDLVGDRLKRPPRGYDADHPLIEDLKCKDHIGVCELEHDALLSPSIVKETAAAFRAAVPYMQFLCGAIGVKF
jgi:uncharacterized protein (TIGR02453 family)